MCIIAYIPEGKQISDEVIHRMFKNNPDGAGIMWKPLNQNIVEIRKGFMTVEKLLAAYHQVPVECEKAIHCRIATSGKVGTGCCHPFPVRAKTSAMMNGKDNTVMAIMHNGMIDYCTPQKGMKSNVSDSMIFAEKVLFPMRKMLDKPYARMLIENSTSSRLLIFRAYDETLMFGNWHFDDGVYYSNTTYKPTTYSFRGYNYGCDYDYYDGYGYGNWRAYLDKKPAANTTKNANPVPEVDEEYCEDNIEVLEFEVDGLGEFEQDQRCLVIEDAIETITHGIEAAKGTVVDYEFEECDENLVVLYFYVSGLPQMVKEIAGYPIEYRYDYVENAPSESKVVTDTVKK